MEGREREKNGEGEEGKEDKREKQNEKATEGEQDPKRGGGVSKAGSRGERGEGERRNGLTCASQ